MPSPNTSTVQMAVEALARRSPESAPPALIGFEASRHLSRADFGGIEPLTLDMPIAEETIVGVAIGMARSGRDVVVDLMFEGFLTRCCEPLLVGWPTALGLADKPMGRVVIRMLGAPVTFGGPSHSADVLTMLASVEHALVVHVAGADDVTWALSAPSDKVVLLADSARPELVRGEVIASAPGAVPLRLWRNDRTNLVACSHAELPAVVEEIESGLAPQADVLSSPVVQLRQDDVARVLAMYERVEFRGVSVADA